MPFIADTPEGIEAYYMLARRSALRIEIATGMRHSQGSVMKFLKDKYGYTGNTKKAVLEQYETDLREWGVLHDES